MTRMSNEAERERERVENALFNVASVKKRIGITKIRIRQARDRSGLDRLLEPALADLEDWEISLDATQKDLSKLWKNRYKHNWKQK